jgi:hypothetical protein
MQAIDTFYNGNYYRSRLEARWAVFFDAMKIKYQYEPEGFKSIGSYYLPDFFLPEVTCRSNPKTGVYIEIKPDSYPESYIPQSSWFDRKLILFKGTPDMAVWRSGYDCGFEIAPKGWDNYMGVFKCVSCNHVKIEFNEGSYDACPKCGGHHDYEGCSEAALKSLLKRFEHGKA